VTSVEFYAGTSMIVRDTTAPYTASYTTSTTGSRALTAVAYFRDGSTNTSAAVNVSIGQAPNVPPTVSLTSPAAGASFTAPATVALAATAADSDNGVARVEFYAGSTLVGSDTSSPYSFNWTGAAAGTYSITAVAVDASGARTTSGARSITVAGATSLAPTAVVFQASSDHATNVTSYVLRVFASGANPSTATPVATSDLGKPSPASSGDITVNRASFFSGLAAGNYVATVMAVGPGGQTQSSSVTFSR
jgi:chitinase